MWLGGSLLLSAQFREHLADAPAEVAHGPLQGQHDAGEALHLDGEGDEPGVDAPGEVTQRLEGTALLAHHDDVIDGAGAARVYTLAGIVRYAMPYLSPGSLTDEEAQQVAAFIDGQPRPAFPFKSTDYLTEKLPPDSVYYPKR